MTKLSFFSSISTDLLCKVSQPFSMTKLPIFKLLVFEKLSYFFWFIQFCWWLPFFENFIVQVSVSTCLIKSFQDWVDFSCFIVYFRITFYEVKVKLAFFIKSQSWFIVSFLLILVFNKTFLLLKVVVALIFYWNFSNLPFCIN